MKERAVGLRRTQAELAEFLRARTRPAPVPLVPELSIYQATALTPLWHATAAELERWDATPFWAFPWAGGQALARHLLDHPEAVRGRRVLDFASGSGLVGIAARRAGAARVVATDLSPFCEVVIPMNAALCGVEVEVRLADLLGEPLDGFDLVVAGDVFYERPLAERSLAWFRALAARGVEVLVGDPGRLYSPRAGVEEAAAYDVPVSREIEDRPVMRTWVQRVVP
ncbi:MAG TPA: 50S ribosomal protein L11 methyltransferase [Anaeromyxobacteraceae bacterium]|nr:50S ribosomal protein L11 methyltransferase [Anaeromyxobacteraceae bacterium]